jgi:hypothetical protein
MIWGWVTWCRATHITWVSPLGCLIIQCRPNYKANGLAMLNTCSLYLGTEVKQHRNSQYLDGWPLTALEVCVHPISKKTAEQLLASGVVSHREELIAPPQCSLRGLIAIDYYDRLLLSITPINYSDRPSSTVTNRTTERALRRNEHWKQAMHCLATGILFYINCASSSHTIYPVLPKYLLLILCTTFCYHISYNLCQL